jgi:hypothetical protein
MPISRRLACHATFTLPLAAALGVPLGAAAAPVVVEGRRFDERLRLYGSDLLLNGTGVRAVAWFKGYAAGLYLTARAGSPAAVVATPGPKRLRLQLLQDVPAQEFRKAFEKGVSRNTPAAELPRLQERMDRFEAMIDAVGRVRKSDIVDLDLEPVRGLAFSLNGTLRGPLIPGDDFYAALLRAFVGDKPYDDALKAGLLGQRT